MVERILVKVTLRLCETGQYCYDAIGSNGDGEYIARISWTCHDYHAEAGIDYSRPRVFEDRMTKQVM